MFNGICPQPGLCLQRAAEGHKDKRWWTPDSSTVNQELQFPEKLLIGSQDLEKQVKTADGTGVDISALWPPSNSLPGAFILCQICKCLH